MTGSRVQFLVRGVVSAALIGYVLRKVNWTALGRVLINVDVRWACLGSALTFALIAGLAIRWRIFLRQQSLLVAFSRVFSLTWAGQFFNAVLPGSTGGDVVKIYQLCRVVPNQKAAAAATVFTDRISAFIALVVMGGATFLIDPVPLRVIAPQDFAPATLVAAGFVLAIVGCGVIWLAYRALRATRIVGRIERTLSAARQSLRPTLGLVGALTLAFGLHALNFFIFYCFCRALHVAIAWPEVLLMMPVLMLLVMLPVTINGHGLRELLLVGYFTHFGVTIVGHSGMPVQDIAVAVSLLGVTNELLWSIPGGLWYLARTPGRAGNPATELSASAGS